MRIRQLAAAAACVFLASCASGGGGGSGGSSGGGSGGGGGGPVTPPTPPPTNSSLTGALVSESFTNNAATGTALFSTTGGAPTTSASQVSATIAYDSASDGYSITIDGRTQTFLKSNLDSAQSNAAVAVYVKTNGATTDSLTITKPGASGRFTYQYVGSAFWQRTTQGASTISGSFDAITYGVETPDAAVPRTGVAEYAVDLVGVETIVNNIFAITGTGKTQIDFASGAIVTHGKASAGNMGSGEFSSEARLSSTANAFSGSFRFNDQGEFSGAVDGRLYGPAAQEIGAVFSAKLGGMVVEGTLTGRGGAVNTANGTAKTLTVDEFITNDAALLKATLKGASGSNNSGQTFTASSAQSSPLILNYDADTKAYTVIASDRSQYFLGNRTQGSVTETLLDSTPANDLQNIPYATFTNLQYVTAKRWTTATGVGSDMQYRIEEFTSGVETPDAAVPRTGTAGYAIGLTGMAADANFPNLTKIIGFGALTADFAAGKLTAEGQIVFAEDYVMSGRAPGRVGGSFSANGVISSTGNSFNGPITFDGLGSYSGTFNGRFYGPQAQELGAAFTATDGAGGVAAGVFVGGLDALATTKFETLATLSKPTALTSFTASPKASLAEVTGVSYDPATKSYTVSFSDTHLFGAPTYAMTLGAANHDDAASNATWDVYAGQINGLNYVASQLRPGAANPKLALSYSSLALITAPRPPSPQNTDPRDGAYYVAFGLPTSRLQMPISGRGDYTGIAVGAGKVTTNAFSGGPGTTSFYALDGSFAFSADFNTSGFTSTVNVVGKDMTTGTSTAFAPISVSGNITYGDFFGGFNGNSMTGRFFGPHAEEVGGTFNYFQTDGAGTLVELNGAMVGKR